MGIVDAFGCGALVMLMIVTPMVIKNRIRALMIMRLILICLDLIFSINLISYLLDLTNSYDQLSTGEDSFEKFMFTFVGFVLVTGSLFFISNYMDKVIENIERKTGDEQEKINDGKEKWRCPERNLHTTKEYC